MRGHRVLGGEWMNELRIGAREWLSSVGEVGRFGSNVVRDVWGFRVFRFFGETLRQSGILIISSTLVIWGLVFIAGLGSCGIEGAYFTQSQGAPDYAGVFTAWCNLREVVPYVFGYMMAAKVGTGIVAELGAMRISDEIDALEVMGVDSMTFLCATRLLGRMVGAAVHVHRRDRGGVFRLLHRGGGSGQIGFLGWLFPALLAVSESRRLLIQLDQGDVDGDRDRVGGLLLRLQRQRGTRGRGHGDGEVDGA